MKTVLHCMVTGVITGIIVVAVGLLVMLNAVKVDYHLTNPAPFGSWEVSNEKLIKVLNYSDEYRSNIVVDEIHW